MGHYRSNLRDLEFTLFEVLGRGEVLGAGPYADVDTDTAATCSPRWPGSRSDELADSLLDSDRNPPVFDPTTHSVTLPEAFKASYRAYLDAEWWRMDVPVEIGGMPVPPSLRWAVAELVLGANPAVHMYSAGFPFAHVVLHRSAPRTSSGWPQLMVDHRWGATMVLTEPDAGSDVGAGTDRAVRRRRRHLAHRGRQALHHLRRGGPVRQHRPPRARPTRGCGGPGTKGLSLFVVPKHHVDLETGELGERNGAYVTNVEHKMGLRSRPPAS